MIDALRFEWVRIRTLRSTYWLGAFAVVLTAAVAFIIAFATRNDSDALGSATVGEVLTGGGSFAIPFVPIFMAITGVFATGHEYRHGTIQPTLTTIPQRSVLLTAKIVIVAFAAILITLVSLVLNYGIGMLFWGEAPSLADQPLNEALPGYLVYVVIYAVLGLALGQLFRGVPSALVILLVVPLVVETLIAGLSLVPALDWLQPSLKFLPFSAGGQLMATEAVNNNGDGPDFDYFDRWVSGGVFAIFVAVILIVAWTLFKKRDA
jgi:ABC-type transport system involved in multi-copper enzyme maturation permease subunit